MGQQHTTIERTPDRQIRMKNDPVLGGQSGTTMSDIETRCEEIKETPRNVLGGMSVVQVCSVTVANVYSQSNGTITKNPYNSNFLIIVMGWGLVSERFKSAHLPLPISCAHQPPPIPHTPPALCTKAHNHSCATSVDHCADDVLLKNVIITLKSLCHKYLNIN